MIEKLYTVEEVAELASVTGRTIRNYQKSGRLTGRKIGGQWRFSEDEVQRLLSGEAPLTPVAPEPVDFGDDFDTPLYSPEEVDPAENTSDLPPLMPEHPAPHTLPDIPSEEDTKPAPVQQQPTPAQPAQQPQQTPTQQPVQQQVQQAAPVQQQPTIVQQPVTYPNIYSAPIQQQPYAPVHIAQPAIAFEQPFTQYAPAPYAPMGPLQTPIYGPSPSFVYTAQIAQPQIQQQPQQQPQAVAPPAPEPAEKNERPKKKAPPQDDLLSQLSDVGRRVATFASEVHDCSDGPQVCAMIDMHQSLAAAKATSERLADYARQESEDGPICRVFVEFDARYYIARYTLFGTSTFLSRCLMLIG